MTLYIDLGPQFVTGGNLKCLGPCTLCLRTEPVGHAVSQPEIWAAPLGLCCATYHTTTAEEAAPVLSTRPNQGEKESQCAQEAGRSMDTLSGHHVAFEWNEECRKLFMCLSLVSCDFLLIAIKSESALLGPENRGSASLIKPKTKTFCSHGKLGMKMAHNKSMNR